MASVDHSFTIGDVNPSSRVYVPGQQTFIWQLGVSHAITQFAYDFKTGLLRNASSPQMTAFVFNSKDGMVWGHGVAPDPVNGTYWTRTLEKLDPATLKVELVAALPSLTTDALSKIALDVDKQMMFWPTALFKDAGKPSAPIYLAQVSIANASIVSLTGPLCPASSCPECGPSTCPMSLDFF